MEHRPTSKVLPALAVLAAGYFLVNCSGLSPAGGKNGRNTPPAPRTESGDDVGVAYLQQQGQWFQLQINLEHKGPRHDAEYDIYHLHFSSKVSVWRYHPATGEYDIHVNQGYAGPGANQGLAFSLYGDSEVKLQMSAANSGSSGGSAGWPNENSTSARITIDPALDSSGVTGTDSILFTVKAIATVEPTLSEKKNGVEPVEATAEQKWKATIQNGKRAKIQRVATP